MNQTEPKTQNTAGSQNDETAKRLPCRGCKPQCENYDRCDGKPWRIKTN